MPTHSRSQVVRSVDRPEVLFGQYKLAVEMADRISGRRQAANAFFAPIVAALTVTNGSDLVTEGPWSYLVSTVSVLICVLWWQLLLTYRRLNSAKFRVIHELEEYLPASLFSVEEVYYTAPEGPRHIALSKIESAIPLLLAVAHVAIIVIVSVG